MTARLRRVGDVLGHERIAVDPDPQIEYVKIGVRSFGKGIFHYSPTTGDQLGSLRFFALRPNRLVISNIKGWEGAIAVSARADAHCVASNRFLCYRPIDDQIDVRWARWYFLSEPGIEQIRRASPGSADRNRTLAIDRFEALEIPLPPIDEQRRIAGHLDRLASSTERANELSVKSSTLTEALTVSVASRPDLSDQAKAAAGWTWTSLNNVLTLAGEQVRVDPSASYSNLGIYSFGRGVFKKPDIQGFSSSAVTLSRIRAGQFIYSRLFAFEGAYAYVPTEFDGYFVSNEFPTFDPDRQRLDSLWLAAYLRSPDRWAELAGASKGIGVRRKRVPVGALLNYEIWLPPIEAQHATVAMIEKLARVRESRERSAQRLDSLISAALNSAFAPGA